MKTAGQLAMIWFIWGCWTYGGLPSAKNMLIVSVIAVFIVTTIKVVKDDL